MKKKILLTGGHLTPALAIIPPLKRAGFEMYFVGRKYAMEQDKTPSEEYREINKLNIPFYPISTGRLQRKITPYTINSLIKIPFGFFQAIKIIKKISPDVIFSFGGYIALPIVIAGKIMGIKIITHEQTVTIGLANKIISRLSDLILVSHKESLSSFPTNKTILTGNPLREEIFCYGKNISPKNNIPVIYITGGNQGAHAINLAIKNNLEKLLQSHQIIHQTGSGVNFKDFKILSEIKNSLPPLLKNRYSLFPYVESKDIGAILNNCDLIVSRSGANTIAEVLALKKPAVFIPLPGSGNNEQYKNAKKLVDLNVATIIDQKDLEKNLVNVINETIENIQNINNNYKKINSYDKQTPAIVVSKIVQLLSN